MNWFESLIYGAVSGITEFLPISSFAHQKILLKLFGVSAHDPLLDLFVHLALLAAIVIGGKNLLDQLQRGRYLRKNNRRGVRGNNDVLEMRFLKNAAIPMLIVYFVLMKCIPLDNNMLAVSIFSLINALIIFFSSRIMHGTKDEHSVSILDSILVGLAGALSVFPGISRVAAMLAMSTICGIEKKKATNWVLLLNIPALLLLIVIDIFSLFSAVSRANICGNLGTYILSAIGAFSFGYVGVLLTKSISIGKDNSKYSFYAFGVTLFSLFLYLLVA